MSESEQVSEDDPIRVMVVDDSAVVRGLISRMLEQDSTITVVESATNGQVAIDRLKKHLDIDVIILDIEMPVMDGLTALPKLLEVDPEVKIIMASTLTSRNADISIRALSAGASDYIPKPSSSRELTGGQDFRRDLLEKVKSLGAVRRLKGGPRPEARRVDGKKRARMAARPAPGPVVLRKPGLQRPEVLAIGSSTGGPQALFNLLGDLKNAIKIPILITQHMPPTFTRILSEHISRMTGWPCGEGTEGDVIAPGRVYMAPGDYHMLIRANGALKVIHLDQGPPVNFCRPSVDPMLDSIAKAYNGHVLTAILTGMGTDGLHGGKVVTEAGGTLIAQDEGSSVVWGMPGAVATAGLCSAVLPLEELGPGIIKFMTRGEI